MSAGPPDRHPWTFLTNHAHVLLAVARAPDIRVAELAAEVGVTTRAALGILRDEEVTAVLDQVARLRPTALAYLSCNASTLARDLRALTEAGFLVDRLTPFDMHPHTPHVEVLATLRARR